MTTLLIGANGQLGSELRQVFSDDDLVLLTHADLELTDPVHVKAALRHYRPDLILNTAAYHPPWPIQGETAIWYGSRHPLLCLLDLKAMCGI